MTKTSKSYIFSVIATSLFIFISIKNLTLSFINYGSFGFLSLKWVTVFIAYIGIALIPMLKTRKKIFVIFPALMLLSNMISDLSYYADIIINDKFFFSYIKYNLPILASDIFTSLGYFAFFIMVLINFTRHPAKAVSKNKIWFLPAFFYVIPKIIVVIGNIYTTNTVRYTVLNSEAVAYVFTFIELAAIICFCLWLKTDTAILYDALPEEEKNHPAVQSAAAANAPGYCGIPAGILGRADAIAEYKKLLDNGTITLEEFERKKNELLKI